jgi:D-alanyl-D-alanine carboxypeptidase
MRKHYERFASWHKGHQHHVRRFVLFSILPLFIGGGIGIFAALWHSHGWRATHSVEVRDVRIKPTADPVLPLVVQDPTNYLMVVNKKHPLPSTFIPSDLVDVTVPHIEQAQLRREPATALVQLFKAAEASGVHLTVVSGYRSYVYQKQLYDDYVANKGAAVAADLSALPGYSEHQSGLAADIDPLAPTSVAEAQGWLAKNAWQYGFIIRYLSGKSAITGYQYEPWHIRYVGIPMAKTLTHLGITLEEFYSIPGGNYTL